MEIQEVTSKMAPKSYAQAQQKRQPRFTSQQLHVVLVIDASLSTLKLIVNRSLLVFL